MPKLSEFLDSISEGSGEKAPSSNKGLSSMFGFKTIPPLDPELKPIIITADDIEWKGSVPLSDKRIDSMVREEITYGSERKEGLILKGFGVSFGDTYFVLVEDPESPGRTYHAKISESSYLDLCQSFGVKPRRSEAEDWAYGMGGDTKKVVALVMGEYKKVRIPAKPIWEGNGKIKDIAGNVIKIYKCKKRSVVWGTIDAYLGLIKKKDGTTKYEYIPKEYVQDIIGKEG